MPPIAAPLPVVALPIASVAAPTAPPPEPIVDDSLRVRAVLSQYEAAYSALNVDAPRVSLGQCSLAIDGPAARADCHGHASYTPQGGGGARTETRQWRFELKNAGGTWQIVRAEVR